MKRTNIEVNETLVNQLKKATGLKTTKEVVNYSLEKTCLLAKQRGFLKLFGSASYGGWEGNLNTMRQNRGK